MSKGILYGVSTGPGDPELVTLKAIKCIEKCQVIAAPRTNGGSCMALDIMKKALKLRLDEGADDTAGCLEKKEIIYLDFLMSKDKNKLIQTHEMLAQIVEEKLEMGQDVALLNIGDVSIFGTFGYIREIVEKDGYETKAIAGVPSFCAVAAELGENLTRMDETLTIIPGSFGGVEEELDRPGTKVIMKSGKELELVKTLIKEKGMSAHAKMVANCGLDNQQIYKNVEDSDGCEGYFVTIVID